MSSRLCAVCKDAEAKYKCPTCRTPFCSVPCNKQHKQTPCSPAPAPHAHTAPAPGPPPRVPGRARPALPAHLADAPTALTAAQAAGLRGSAAVAAAARDPALQDVLRRVDGARDREAALAAELRDPRFAAFADLMLEAVGAGEGCRERREEERREEARAELRRVLHG